jgi:hypothetical protein
MVHPPSDAFAFSILLSCPCLCSVLRGKRTKRIRNEKKISSGLKRQIKRKNKGNSNYEKKRTSEMVIQQGLEGYSSQKLPKKKHTGTHTLAVGTIKGSIVSPVEGLGSFLYSKPSSQHTNWTCIH